jgi:hypothetical protein
MGSFVSKELRTQDLGNSVGLCSLFFRSMLAATLRLKYASAIIWKTGFLDFVHRLDYKEIQNVSEAGSPSIFR